MLMASAVPLVCGQVVSMPDTSNLVHSRRRVFSEAGVNSPDRNAWHPSVFRTAPFFIDAAVSPIHGNGTPMPNAHSQDGAAIAAASMRNPGLRQTTVSR